MQGRDVGLIKRLQPFAPLACGVSPERRLYAKGSGAFGTFTVTRDITRYTCANLFSTIGRETPVFVRFAAATGERGAADAERDVRGFSIKFHTDEGHWDLVGTNSPVYFLNDPDKFFDLQTASNRDPRTHLRSPKTTWEFWATRPEALHQITILMSDRGIPASYRHMHGYGGHTFSFINAFNQRLWVKFHFKSHQGIMNLSNADATTTIGEDRDSHQRDLHRAIATGNYPRWTLHVQVMLESDGATARCDPFDLTKVWPHRDFPLIKVGVLELNRNPQNYLTQVEQSTFNPASVVPGVGFSPDRMLQSRLAAYHEAQRYRLGLQHHNASAIAHAATGRDCQMVRHDPHDPHDLHTFYDPDPFSQPGALFRLMNAVQRNHLYNNTARSLSESSPEIKLRHIRHCLKADPDYGNGIAIATGVAIWDAA